MGATLTRSHTVAAAVVLLLSSLPLPVGAQLEQPTVRVPDLERIARNQAETDRKWREAGAGFMQVEKIVYPSRTDGLEIPAFVFQPLNVGGPQSHAARIGYGRAFYDAIDYGGAEVDDVVTAAAVIATKYSHVDPRRIGIIGWSHGGMIALLGAARNRTRSAQSRPSCR